MSSAMENRAAVFTSDPQAVEIYQSGAWWPGELLGWRHGDSGSCQVWVRVALGGVAESAWTDLTSLRLPEPQVAPASDSVATPDTRSRSLAAVPVVHGVVGGFDADETASLPLVRDRSVAPSRRPGVTRSPVAEASAVAQSAVPAQASVGVTPTSGRRRAPEGTPPAASSTVEGSVRGRHRAPGDPGRHRAADTGLLSVVTADMDEPVTAQRPAVVPGGRPIRPTRASQPSEPLSAETRAPSPRDGWSSVDPEPDLLTRPMRLSDLGSQARRPRLDGFLASV